MTEELLNKGELAKNAAYKLAIIPTDIKNRALLKIADLLIEKSDEIIKISKAVLKIINKRGEQVSFNIGNISMVSGEYFTLLETKSIVGITKFIENYSTLDKVKMELYNFQLYDVYLKEIKLVSSVVETISKNTKISTGKTIDLEIPLIYLENTFIDNVGVILVLEYQGSIYEQIINPYVLFKTSTIHTKPLVQVYEVY